MSTQEKLPAHSLDSVANNAKLRSCPGPHNFAIPRRLDTGEVQDPKEITDKRKAQWECSKCGGRVFGNAKIWYEAGFQDALKSFAPAPVETATPKKRKSELATA